ARDAAREARRTHARALREHRGVFLELERLSGRNRLVAGRPLPAPQHSLEPLPPGHKAGRTACPRTLPGWERQSSRALALTASKQMTAAASRPPSLRVPHRFRGPTFCAYVGYLSGLIARVAARPVTVRLLKPAPLDTDFRVARSGDVLEVLHVDEPIAQARPA